MHLFDLGLEVNTSFLGCLHEFFFLSFVCFMSHMSEFDALLASRRSF